MALGLIACATLGSTTGIGQTDVDRESAITVSWKLTDGSQIAFEVYKREGRSAASHKVPQDYRQHVWPSDGIDLVPVLSTDVQRECGDEAIESLRRLAGELNGNLKSKFELNSCPTRAAMVIHFSEERLTSPQPAEKYRLKKFKYAQHVDMHFKSVVVLYEPTSRELVYGYHQGSTLGGCSGESGEMAVQRFLKAARYIVLNWLMLPTGLDSEPFLQEFHPHDSATRIGAFYAHLERIGAIERGLSNEALLARLDAGFGRAAK